MRTYDVMPFWVWSHFYDDRKCNWEPM